MPPSSRIPPLLQPHVCLPRDDSILLLTSTLGASANWLITRFLGDALNLKSGADGGSEGAGRIEDGEGCNVLLVSWMREYEFWKQDCRKGVGVDLERGRREGRVVFVDGLSSLFLEEENPENNARTAVPVENAPAVRSVQSLPARGPAPGRMGGLPARGPPAAPTTTSPTTIRSGTTAPTSTSHNAGCYSLKSPNLAHLKTTITTALTHLTSASPARKTLLVIDNPDILLATNPALTHTSITSLLLSLHARPDVAHMLIHLQADTPLLGIHTPPQPLEVAQRNLLVKLAHMSRRVIGVRVLDTGVARDVSGVLRVTENDIGFAGLKAHGRGEDGGEGKRREMLYKVNGDGSVKVFERGAGGEG
ncbi:hypothetical protein P280DRAFT_422348 [Massarina eburnea CBS 473.64]|uniref:Elongator complex protein 6 n=1 Tax=Massarina eburnea CBS 473.64 TaxID=1395130 RepID=A0A6A6S8C7_9PLEO|nr:hypothetical protein P280DRAFT_422348 [Massarina eburnea CBS 473.64]